MKTKIFHANNSAVLLEYNDTKILIDGIYGGSFPTGESIRDVGMSEMPELYKEMLDEGKGIFEKVDLLLFSHCHHDHYNQFEVEKYREANPNVRFFEPSGLKNNIVPQKKGDMEVITEGDIEIYLLPVKHLDLGKNLNKFSNIAHCSYCIKCGDESFFIAGDGSFDEGVYDILEKNELIEYNCIFVNVIHLLTKENRAYFKKFAPYRMVLYHLPSKEDDCLNYWSLLEQAKKNYPSCLAPLIVAEHMEWLEL